jgi:hypothetical protein
MDQILRDYGIDGRVLTCEQLVEEAGIEDVYRRMIQIHMDSLDYRKCLACKKGWMSQKAAARRVEYARTKLSLHPEEDYQLYVRFSDEMHSGFGSEHTLHIIRRPGERYCPDCVQHAPEPDEKDKKRQDLWAAAGYNFKSHITFYEVHTNSNGKTSQQVYRDVILQSIVKPWLDASQRFILEEDGDSGHGPGRQNII